MTDWFEWDFCREKTLKDNNGVDGGTPVSGKAGYFHASFSAGPFGARPGRAEQVAVMVLALVFLAAVLACGSWLIMFGLPYLAGPWLR